MTLPQEVKGQLEFLGVSQSDFVEICRRYTKMSWQTDPDLTEKQYRIFKDGVSYDGVELLLGEKSERPLWEGQMYHVLHFLQMNSAAAPLLRCDC